MHDSHLIAALDVDYRDPIAVAAGVWFRGWSAATSEREAVAVFNEVADYRRGEFYRRELPCLLAVLAKGPEPRVVVIDGYVWLGEGRAHARRLPEGALFTLVWRTLRLIGPRADDACRYTSHNNSIRNSARHHRAGPDD